MLEKLDALLVANDLIAQLGIAFLKTNLLLSKFAHAIVVVMELLIRHGDNIYFLLLLW